MAVLHAGDANRALRLLAGAMLELEALEARVVRACAAQEVGLDRVHTVAHVTQHAREAFVWLKELREFRLDDRRWCRCSETTNTPTEVGVQVG